MENANTSSIIPKNILPLKNITTDITSKTEAIT